MYPRFAEVLEVLEDDVTIELEGLTSELLVTFGLDVAVVAGLTVVGRVVAVVGLLAVVGVTVRLEVDEVAGFAVALLVV